MARPLIAAGMWAYSALLKSTPGSVQERVLHKLRGLLVRLGDPTVTFNVAGAKLQMPLSHDLPLYLERFPLYSDNLARLATACAEVYPVLSVVDIGANVGDSLAFIHRAAVADVLCVEGNPRYLDFLRTNVATLASMASVAPVLMGARSGELDAPFVTSQGTGGFRTFSDTARVSPVVRTVSLDDLLGDHPPRGRFKLLKSDTDGFEAHILQGGIESVRRHRPVLFFEYHPHLLATNGSDGLELLSMLRKESYSGALVYDNLGELLLSLRLDEVVLLEEIHRYFSGAEPSHYLDFAAFHIEDDPLFESFRRAEHEFYGMVPPA